MWFTDACFYSYCITFLLVFFLTSNLSFLSFVSPCFLFPLFFFSTSYPSPILLFMATPFYIIYYCKIYPFCPSTTFGSLWASLQDYPLACRVSSHYLCPECVGCTTFYLQTKLFVLFLTSPCSCFTLIDKY